MWRISGYFISLLLLLSVGLSNISAQDTLQIPLKIKIGIEAIGPAIYFIEKNTLSTEAYVSVDLNEKISPALAMGYLNYKYSQYNYTYLNKGVFLRAGVDFNLLKPKKSMGIYWAGLSLRYGLSRFSSEVTNFRQVNYWGEVQSSIADKKYWGHFIEASPGIRAQMFPNFSMGWTVSVRMLLYSNTGKDQKAIYFPGFGDGTKRVSTGFNYFLVWNIPYKKIRVIIKKEEPEEEEPEDNKTNPSTNPAREQSPGNDFR